MATIFGKTLVSTGVATSLFIVLTPGILFLFGKKPANLTAVLPFPFPHPEIGMILLHALVFAALYFLIMSDIDSDDESVTH